MSQIHQLHQMPVVPDDFKEALFQSFLSIAVAHHPAIASWKSEPFTPDEAAEREAEQVHLSLVDAGLLDEEPEDEADTWPPVHEPVAESDLAWASDLSDFDRFGDEQ